MEKRQIADEMVALIRQLTMQNQIKMAGLVLQSYFQRVLKIDEELSAAYVRLYFQKFFPVQLERHLKRLNHAS